MTEEEFCIKYNEPELGFAEITARTAELAFARFTRNKVLNKAQFISAMKCLGFDSGNVTSASS
jgi:hypothetical protein